MAQYDFDLVEELSRVELEARKMRAKVVSDALKSLNGWVRSVLTLRLYRTAQQG